VIRIRINDPRSVWIMVHQRNRWIYDQSGFAGSFDGRPWSSRSWITDLDLDYPKRNAAIIMHDGVYPWGGLNVGNLYQGQRFCTKKDQQEALIKHFFYLKEIQQSLFVQDWELSHLALLCTVRDFLWQGNSRGRYPYYEGKTPRSRSGKRLMEKARSV